MPSSEREYLLIDASLSADAEIGRWLWALQDGRRRTLEKLANLPEAALDWLPPDGESSIGTVLYHLALIEADWLYAEVLEQPDAAILATLFPTEVRDANHHLSQVAGLTLAEHLTRLEQVRALLLAAYQAMDGHDFRRVRHLPAYDVTPEWVLHHLLQHEAEHRSQLDALRIRAQAVYFATADTADTES